ncbi:zf-TFIIB domain-containing protein [Isoptericola sp. BMS4]|uniref:TFIIB-type zinc ribbon-containing protein n=1 Tax=Isoptericola sp. BMS4 TaxID=2527875 RepID=UPI00142043E8|nr:zf-TFIIB domain-containing protein [Isoptericola sp. BMS4]
MQCPHDQTVLVMTERKGVEIDYCPRCRGVWLDRGELDKIIDRSLEAEIATEALGPLRPAPASSPARYEDDRRVDGGYAGYDRRGGDDRRRKKKESWLGDLFDF